MDDLERAVRRYRRAAKAVEAVAGGFIVAMALVLLLGSGPWVGGVALVFLLAAIGVYVSAWPLARKAAAARWQLAEQRSREYWTGYREDRNDRG